MARILIVCEGPDDRTALREYLVRWRHSSSRAKADRMRLGVLGGRSEHRFETDPTRTDVFQHQVIVAEAKGKPGLARRVLDLASPNADPPMDTVIVTFDPDKVIDLADEFAFFEERFADELKAAPAENGVGPIGRTTSGSYRFSIHDRPLELLPVPWRTPANPSFDDLPDERNLERVLIEGMLQVHAEGEAHRWVLDALTNLKVLVNDHGWKRALRLWNAVVYPDTSESSFIAQLFQYKLTREGCTKAIEATGLGAHLERLLPLEKPR